MAPTDLLRPPTAPAVDRTTTLSHVEAERVLRLVPLPVLVRRRTELVQLLMCAPQAHDRLRSSWARQDPQLTSRIFGWVEQARLHRSRSDGQARQVTNWMRDGDTPTGVAASAA